MKKRILMLSACLLLAGLSGCGRRTQQSTAESRRTERTDEQPVITVEIVTQDDASETTTVTTTKKPVTETAAETTVSAEEATSFYEIETETLTETEALTVEAKPDKDGVYTTKDDVALYIYTYGELPKNFITKKEAQKLGWTGGSLEPYAPGCCIGGSYFGNYEGSLPEKKGRSYTECDIDTLGKSSRGAKRIVFSNDGLIYYTGDHYKTFELLYGEE